MQGGARLQSHSIHPTLVVLPLGLLSTSVVFDFIHLLGGGPIFTQIAYYMIFTGLITGVAAALLGWIDQMGIPRHSRPYTLGIVHGIVNLLVLGLYAGSMYVRSNDASRPEILPAIFSTLGAGFALIGGCLGGELAQRLNDAHQAGEHREDLISLSIGGVTKASSILVQRQQP